MTFGSTDSVTSCIGFTNNKANGDTPMSDDTIPDGDEWDRPTLYQFTSPLRMIEMLRADLEDVAFLSLNHFAILLIIFEMEDERFGLEAQTIHSLAGVEKSTANRIVHSLSDKGRSTRDGLGYVVVKTDVNDRRIRRVFLTEKGRMLKQKLATAGTELDNAEVTRMYQAYDATRVLSLEKAHGFSEAEIGERETISLKVDVKRKSLMNDPKQVIKTRFALDRAVRAALGDRRNWVSYQGNNVPLLSHDEMRSSLDTLEVKMLAGRWMLFDKEDKLSMPVSIQRDLMPGAELASYMNGLVFKLNKGSSFTEVMRSARSELNQTEYGRLRSRMTKNLADTRDSLMKNVELIELEVNEKEESADHLSRTAGTMHRMSELAMNRAQELPDDAPEKTLNMVDALDLAQESARKHGDALSEELRAQKLREEHAAMKKALDDNAKVMAEMQAMMKQMLDNK